MLAITAVTTFLSLAPAALAWGSLGHRTVAYLAAEYLTPAGTSMVRSLLDQEDISSAALYPDEVRRRPGWAYSAPWHFIDARDDPPETCGLNLTRDCLEDGCVVSAIKNNTERLLDPSLSADDRTLSLKFILHFIGDVHQPLHTEALDKGGNGIKVSFGRRHANLHEVWDTLIPEKRINLKKKKEDEAENEMEFAQKYAKALFARDAHPDISLREECHDVTDPVGCALLWASDANKWVCEYVLKGGVDELENEDLSQGYYDGAIKVVDEMLSKAGRRLGGWLNTLAEHEETMMRTQGDLYVQDL